MKKERITACRALLLGTVVLSCIACGKDDTEVKPAIAGDFLQKANEVCAAALARRPEAPPPLPVEDFDPKQPQPEQLPPIGAHFSQFNDGERVAAELASLGEPAQGSAEWQALVALARRSAQNTTAQIEAAKASDVAAFVRLVEAGEGIAEEFRRVGPAAGFSGSSACGKYYTG